MGNLIARVDVLNELVRVVCPNIKHNIDQLHLQCQFIYSRHIDVHILYPIKFKYVHISGVNLSVS